QDFVRTAHAKGLPKAIVLKRHVMRAGLIPILTMMGLQFAYMMGGAIVVENIFAWNGIGRLAIEAIFQRDYPVIQGFILVFASTRMGAGKRLLEPSLKYLLGTDEFGRDMFSRIVYGSRLTLQIGAIAVGISLTVGVAIGLVAAYARGVLEKLLMRSVDVLFS